MKVKISGTMTKDTEPDNGLDGDVGDKLTANPMARVAVTALVELHGYHRVKGKPEYISVRFVAIEAAQGDDDITVRNILDESRKARGLGPTSLTLFDATPDDEGAAKGPWPGDVDFIAPAAAGEQDATDTAKTDPPIEPVDPPAAKPKRASKRALAAVADQP